jgi:hypothetical protein
MDQQISGTATRRFLLSQFEVLQLATKQTSSGTRQCGEGDGG